MRTLLISLAILMVAIDSPAHADEPPAGLLSWSELPALPDSLGVAGALAGVHRDALIVAGGTNFPVATGEKLWEVPKAWYAAAWVLERGAEEWLEVAPLAGPVGYGACVSTEYGVVCVGGSDGERILSGCFLLRWDPASRKLGREELPPLPRPCAHGAAALIGSAVYLVGGQRGLGLESAGAELWRLDLARMDGAGFAWEALAPLPGPGRAHLLAVAQHNGYGDCLYAIGGRRQTEGVAGLPGLLPLSEVWEYNPQRAEQPWRRRADAPTAVMAGAGVALGQAHVVVLSGADGSHIAEVLHRGIEMADYAHPGFPRRTWTYHTITDTWIDAGPSPANQVSTPAVWWGGRIVLASGELRPRVRTRAVWAIEPLARTRSFGVLNYTVLAIYLAAMVGVGIFFAYRSKDTDDFFRGGQSIPWWVAGCSIFATMLSSITFMAIPAKAYAQDLVYLFGNFMILAVAPLAVYLALPYFRRIDATSAYEYLEQRFNRPVRLFASASFTLFHLFRMGIVLSLAALALSTVADFSGLLRPFGMDALPGANAMACVFIMGALSILYCTMGGVKAVVWTDTIQTFVLLGGALLCFGLMVWGAEGGLGGFFATAAADGKLRLFDLHWDPTSASLALWVVLIGGIGQNASSYTADQAIVQRYMTTPDRRRAARAIWTNAFLAIPASILFYLVGTALYTFYKAHPERLDPTANTDQIFPLFIASEVPIGLAGLIVAGIFAAAQSTISTSMNSTATTVVTDFLRPFGALRTERGYLRMARVLTLLFGIGGTILGLLFVAPDIKSLFDAFIRIVGLFMGVLGGLFLLGMLTRRASPWGAFIGALAGAAVMGLLPVLTHINGYLYAAIGISVCFAAGYVSSLWLPASGSQGTRNSQLASE